MSPRAEYHDPDKPRDEPTTLQDIRRWIATHPLGPDDYGKGYVTPFGHRIAWITKPMYGAADGWPAHVDGIRALGYLTESYDQHWRDERATFKAEPGGVIQEWVPDYDAYGDPWNDGQTTYSTYSTY